MAKTIIELQHVDFSYNSMSVLSDVNFTVYEKDFLSIIGPNGGGKTTILKLICGLLKPQRGTIRVFGESPVKARVHIGYLPQNLVFDFDFPIRVIDVVLMGRLGKTGIGHPFTRSDRSVAIKALEQVGCADLSNRPISHLSGGQRQRILIARALTTDPKLLLLDEPVSSIDTQWQHMLYELLKQLNEHMAIILVTHDISVVSTYIDKIACLNKKLYFHGSKKEGMQKLTELYECPVQILTHESTKHTVPEPTND